MVVDLSFQASRVPKEARPTRLRHTFRMIRAPLTGSLFSQSRANSAKGLAGLNISKSDPIVISMTAPDIVGVARGFVLDIQPDFVLVGLDHALLDLPCTKLSHRNTAKPVFRIDKDELAAGLGRIRDNLAQLFYASGDARRRELIVDLVEPAFSSTSSSFSEDEQSLTLNEDQRNAVEKVLTAKDYALILGMPGTGKTTTTAEIIVALVNRGKSVLLTSYTHSAVDNILLKLKDRNLDILRLGSSDKVSLAERIKPLLTFLR